MNKDEMDLKNALNKICSEFWKENKKPLLLSKIPAILIENGLNHKTILGQTKIKNFITKTSSADTYKILRHPKKLAMVGILPFNEQFQYPEYHQKLDTPQLNTVNYNNFIITLKSLSNSDLEKVHLPATLFINMWDDKNKDA